VQTKLGGSSGGCGDANGSSADRAYELGTENTELEHGMKNGLSGGRTGL